ncbi:hypothetical protein MTO96_009834 [Rhipicephalus appendiculatus]
MRPWRARSHTARFTSAGVENRTCSLTATAAIPARGRRGKRSLFFENNGEAEVRVVGVINRVTRGVAARQQPQSRGSATQLRAQVRGRSPPRATLAISPPPRSVQVSVSFIVGEKSDGMPYNQRHNLAPNLVPSEQKPDNGQTRELVRAVLLEAKGSADECAFVGATQSRACERPTSPDRAHVSPAAPEESAALSDTGWPRPVTGSPSSSSCASRLASPAARPGLRAHTLRPASEDTACARHNCGTRRRRHALVQQPLLRRTAQGRPPRRRCAVLVLVSARVLVSSTDCDPNRACFLSATCALARRAGTSAGLTSPHASSDSPARDSSVHEALKPVCMFSDAWDAQLPLA